MSLGPASLESSEINSNDINEDYNFSEDSDENCYRKYKKITIWNRKFG